MVFCLTKDSLLSLTKAQYTYANGSRVILETAVSYCGLSLVSLSLWTDRFYHTNRSKISQGRMSVVE